MNVGKSFRFDLWLYNEMKKRHWTQVDLAEIAGVQVSTIHYIVHNKHFPNWQTLSLILEALGMHMEIVED